MATTDFSDGTVITSEWCNEVDALVHDVFSGATTDTLARAALGVAIGSDVQAYDAQLDTWAGVTPGTGVATALAANAGASGGFQLYDAELAALAGLTSAANKVPMFSGSGTATLLDFKDEDNMASDSATAVPSQQSVKAYVDTSIAAINAPVVRAAQATTSGTEFDFTSIPSWATEITVSLYQVSLSGTDNLIVQIGDAGGIENSGYVSYSVQTGNTAVGGGLTSTAGFIVVFSNGTNVIEGLHLTLRKHGTGNIWTESHVGGANYSANYSIHGGGTKTLSDVLTQVRLTRTGTDTFDAGSVSIRYS